VQETSGDGLITDGESLGDVDVWNRLSDRRVFMNFTSNSSSGRIRLEAVIGPMAVIPEPSSLMLVMLGVISLTRKFL